MHRAAWSCAPLLLLTQLAAVSAQSPIDTLALKAHTYFLAHDDLAGRATGTLGAELAALYITSQCRALGLRPADHTYAQHVALEQATVGVGTHASVVRSGTSRTFSYPTHFTPNVGTRATLRDFHGPAVYLGPADQLASQDDFILEGRVAIILGPRASTESLNLLRERGAAGAVLAVPSPDTYALYRQSRGSTRLFHADSSVVSSFIPALPAVIAGPELSYALIAGAPLDRDGQPTPGPLDSEISVHLQVDLSAVSADNVICVLPGARAVVADTAIALSAHYDHLGVVPSGDAGDSIFNGFSDNAAGVAALLAIAQAMVADELHPMQHSVLFLFFVGEERGLLGSDLYVARPSWPLAATKAVINIDAGAPPGRPVSWRLAGVDSTGLGAAAIDAAAARGWQVTTSPPRANSDYFPFVRSGVPGVFVVPGPGSYEGLTADSSDVLRKRWDHYHQPEDEWSEVFPFSGLQRYAEYAYLIARTLDGQRNRAREP